MRSRPTLRAKASSVNKSSRSKSVITKDRSGSPLMRMKGKLQSRWVHRKVKIRKKRIRRVKVRHHNHRRYAGVRGPNAAKHRHYKIKPKSGQGLPPMSVSTYLSMY